MAKRSEAAKPPKEKKPTQDLEALGLQTFKMMKVHRSQLKGAPYNPRVLGEAERRKLKAGIQKHGVVAPPTWNERSGNIVGGHQRLAQLDALAGTSDYTLDVARIDVDDVRERELNVILNNPTAQGNWDLQKLSELLKTPGVDLAGAGFDHADVYRMFGDSIFVDRNDPLDELANRVREARDRYNKIAEDNANRDDTEFYAVVVFRDGPALTDFLKRHGLEDSRYQSGEEFDRICTKSV